MYMRKMPGGSWLNELSMNPVPVVLAQFLTPDGADVVLGPALQRPPRALGSCFFIFTRQAVEPETL